MQEAQTEGRVLLGRASMKRILGADNTSASVINPEINHAIIAPGGTLPWFVNTREIGMQRPDLRARATLLMTCSKPARFRERVIELEVVEPITKTEVTEEGSSEVIAKFNPYGVANVIQTHGTTQPYRASRASSVASASDDAGLQDEPDDNNGPYSADQNPINALVVKRLSSQELEVVNIALNGDSRGTSSPYPPYPEEQSYFENLIVHVSPALSPLRHLPIEYSRHNADFLEMCEWRSNRCRGIEMLTASSSAEPRAVHVLDRRPGPFD